MKLPCGVGSIENYVDETYLVNITNYPLLAEKEKFCFQEQSLGKQDFIL